MSRNCRTRWRELRARVLFRDAYTCALCGCAAGDVHHMIPFADGGTDDAENLRSLCASCHAQQH